MQEFTTKITRKGQITVPVEVRRALGLNEGDKVAVTLPEPGSCEATIRPARSVVDRTYGALRWQGRKFSIDEEESAWAEAAAEKDLRIQGIVEKQR